MPLGLSSPKHVAIRSSRVHPVQDSIQVCRIHALAQGVTGGMWGEW